jgi:ribonuclease BN (tRNA processing enzyme)
MKLVLLGTGGYFPTRRRQTACLILPEIGVVLDAGTGIRELKRHLATDRLDIFLTHAHLDHIAGLTYLLVVAPQEVQSRTIVHGDAAKLAAVREHLFAEPVFPVMPGFQFQPLAERVELPQGGTLTHFALQHPGGSLGFRLDWPDSSLAYVTDTTAKPGAPYIENIRGVDLLIHEAYFPTSENDWPALTGHSSLDAVAALAAEAGVGRLVLVHIDPLIEDDGAFDLDAARQFFPRLELAQDEMELDF